MRYEYRIVSATTDSTLEAIVNEQGKYGWQPQGGPIKDGINWFQSLVREDLSEPEDEDTEDAPPSDWYIIYANKEHEVETQIELRCSQGMSVLQPPVRMWDGRWMAVLVASWFAKSTGVMPRRVRRQRRDGDYPDGAVQGAGGLSYY